MIPDLDLAETDKSELIKLIRYYAVEQIEDYLFVCKLVECELWNERVHAVYWDKFFDGDLDRFSSSINSCFNEFYPLD